MTQLTASPKARAAARKHRLEIVEPEPATEQQTEQGQVAPESAAILRIRAEGEAARAADRADFARRLAWLDEQIEALEGRR